MTASGCVKILDFGIATHADDGWNRKTEDTLTAPGIPLGTACYMAPEQVRGEAVDSRADAFALGVVLYEMLAGRRAFTGETAAARLTAILTADPPELQRQATSLPPAVAGIVHRCLAKTREDGREIYYRSNNRMIAIPVTTAPSLRVGEPGVLFEDAFVSGIIGARAYDVAPDGRFLMMQAIGNRDPREVRIVFDWFSELRARVP